MTKKTNFVKHEKIFPEHFENYDGLRIAIAERNFHS